MSETPWHSEPEALADDWTVPCEFCGAPVRAGNESAEIVAKAAGTERVVARKAWCDKDACLYAALGISEDATTQAGTAAP